MANAHIWLTQYMDSIWEKDMHNFKGEWGTSLGSGFVNFILLCGMAMNFNKHYSGRGERRAVACT